MLWNLMGEKASQVFTAWDTAIKLTWSCPRWTRSFLLQQVLSCGDTSARTDILARYGKFSRGLRTSVSKEVRVMYNMVSRDMQTTTAKNLRFIEAESGTDPWTVSPAKLKQELHSRQLVNIPTEDEWRIRYMSSLLRQLQEAKHLVQEDKISQLQDLIDSLAR